MAINDVAGARLFHARDLREFMGYNFVSGLSILKRKNIKNLKTFS